MPLDFRFMCGVLEGTDRKGCFIDLGVEYAQLNMNKVMIFMFIISLQKRFEMTMSKTV